MVRGESQYVQEGGRGENVNPLAGSHAPIQSLFNDAVARSVVSPSEGVASETKVNQTKPINEGSKSTVGGTGIRTTSNLLRLIKNVVEVTNAEPRSIRIFANYIKRIPKTRSIFSIRRTIKTGQDPRIISRVRRAPNIYVICIEIKAVENNTGSPS